MKYNFIHNYDLVDVSYHDPGIMTKFAPFRNIVKIS